MSRWEFMRQLEQLLSDISPNEREEALQYYNDYFNDAGMENEQEVIKALGSPEQVAKIVKDGLSEGSSQGEFTENGFSSSRAKQNELIKRQASGNASADGEDSVSGSGTDSRSGSAFADKEGFAKGGAFESGYAQNTGDFGQSFGTSEKWDTGSGPAEKEKKDLPVWAIVLIVIACIFCSPVLLGLACSILGVIIGVFAAVFGVIFGVGLAAVILFIVAVCLVAAGLGVIIPHPFSGIGLLGGGFICAALGIMFMLLTVLLVTKVVPAIFQGIAAIYNSIFRKKKGAVA